MVQGKLIQEEKERLEAQEIDAVNEDEPTVAVEEDTSRTEPEEKEEVQEVVSSSSGSTPATSKTSSKKKHLCPHCDYR